MCRERELEGRQRAFERQQQQAPYYPPPAANVPPYYGPPYVTPSTITPPYVTPPYVTPSTITPSTITPTVTTTPTVGNSRFTAPVTMATAGKKAFHLYTYTCTVYINCLKNAQTTVSYMAGLIQKVSRSTCAPIAWLVSQQCSLFFCLSQHSVILIVCPPFSSPQLTPPPSPLLSMILDLLPHTVLQWSETT